MDIKQSGVKKRQPPDLPDQAGYSCPFNVSDSRDPDCMTGYWRKKNFSPSDIRLSDVFIVLELAALTGKYALAVFQHVATFSDIQSHVGVLF